MQAGGVIGRMREIGVIGRIRKIRKGVRGLYEEGIGF